jgi:hypothetical protein
MYTVDDKDTVVPLNEAPQSDVGTPLPSVVSDEHHLYLAYLLSEPDPNWDGTYVNIVGPDSQNMPFAIARFHHAYAHMFGPPNDEAFGGHPLAARGVQPYGAYEVLSSSWIRALERMNSVHPYHQKSMYDGLRHFIFMFHDSTFECVARGFNVEAGRGSMQDAVARMVSMLYQDEG